jgi:hypothetical protein
MVSLTGDLRRRLNATVLVLCLRDSIPAVLASIFGIVDVHDLLLSDSVSSPHRNRQRDGFTRVY